MVDEIYTLAPQLLPESWYSHGGYNLYLGPTSSVNYNLRGGSAVVDEIYRLTPHPVSTTA